jgi:hypothetical protein
MLALIADILKERVIETKIMWHTKGDDFIAIHSSSIRKTYGKTLINRFSSKCVVPRFIKNDHNATYLCSTLGTDININMLKGEKELYELCDYRLGF